MKGKKQVKRLLAVSLIIVIVINVICGDQYSLKTCVGAIADELMQETTSEAEASTAAASTEQENSSSEEAVSATDTSTTEAEQIVSIVATEEDSTETTEVTEASSEATTEAPTEAITEASTEATTAVVEASTEETPQIVADNADNSEDTIEEETGDVHNAEIAVYTDTGSSITITSQDDWDNFTSGTNLPSDFAIEGNTIVYSGALDFTITLACDVQFDAHNIYWKCTGDGQLTIDANGQTITGNAFCPSSAGISVINGTMQNVQIIYESANVILNDINFSNVTLNGAYSLSGTLNTEDKATVKIINSELFLQRFRCSNLVVSYGNKITVSGSVLTEPKFYGFTDFTLTDSTINCSNNFSSVFYTGNADIKLADSAISNIAATIVGGSSNTVSIDNVDFTGCEGAVFATGTAFLKEVNHCTFSLKEGSTYSGYAFELLTTAGKSLTCSDVTIAGFQKGIRLFNGGTGGYDSITLDKVTVLNSDGAIECSQGAAKSITIQDCTLSSKDTASQAAITIANMTAGSSIEIADNTITGGNRGVSVGYGTLKNGHVHGNHITTNEYAFFTEQLTCTDEFLLEDEEWSAPTGMYAKNATAAQDGSGNLNEFILRRIKVDSAEYGFYVPQGNAAFINTLDNCTFSNCTTAAYYSGHQTLRIINSKFTDVTNGVYAATSKLQIKDSEIRGKENTYNPSGNSYGILANYSSGTFTYNDGKQLSDYLKDDSYIDNILIDNFYYGMDALTGGGGCLLVNDSTIQNIHTGIRYDYSPLIVNNSKIVAKENPENDSIGITTSGGRDLCIMDSEITGFHTGGCNAHVTEQTAIINSKLSNSYTNWAGYMITIYKSQLLDAQYGYTESAGPGSNLVGCQIENKNGNGIAGVWNNGGSSSGFAISSVAAFNDKLTNGYDSVYSRMGCCNAPVWLNWAVSQSSSSGTPTEELGKYAAEIKSPVVAAQERPVTGTDDKKRYDSYIIGYLTGVDFDGSLSVEGTSIEYTGDDAIIGIDNKNNTYSLSYGNCEISGFQIGIKANNIYGPFSGDRKIQSIIHDCETGITNGDYGSLYFSCQPSDYDVFDYEIYNCAKGLETDAGSLLGNLYIHDCEDTGLSSAFGTAHVKLARNKNYNASFVTGDMPTISTNSGCPSSFEKYEDVQIVSMNLDIDHKDINQGSHAIIKSAIEKNVTTGKNVYLFDETPEDTHNPLTASGDKINIDDGAIKLIGDTQLFIEIEKYNAPKGIVLELDDDQYYEDRIIGRGTSTTEGCVREIRTMKEGWVVKFSRGSNQLTKGCIITYDLNGGDSFSGTLQKLSYMKNENIDLSVSASKAGCTFIGWNTNPEASDGLSKLSAGTKNVTLYAIFADVDGNIVYNYGDNDDVTWKSSDSTIATVDTNGVVTGHKRGSITITARSKDNPEVVRTVDVNVHASYVTYDYLTNGGNSATVTETQVLFENDRVDLTPTATRDDHKFIGWNTDPKAKTGLTSYTVGDNEDVTLYAIFDIKASDIDVVPENLYLGINEISQLQAIVTTDDATNKEVTWRSDDESIAIVDQSGVVTTKGYGDVKIWATTTDGSNLSDFGTIHVKKRINITYDYETNGGSSVNIRNNVVSYVEGENIALNVKAAKAGYAFRGWSTAANSIVPATDLVAGNHDITVYAIFSKDVTVTYHTIDSTKNYNDTIRFYNNERSKTYTPIMHHATVDKGYKLLGFSEANGEVNSTDIVAFNTDITVSPSDKELYYVYQLQSKLIYVDKDNKKFTEDVQTKILAGEAAKTFEFDFIMRDGIVLESHTFSGWETNEGGLYNAGDVFTTHNPTATARAVYDVIKASNIIVKPKDPEVEVGSSVQLNAIILPEDSYVKNVKWDSADSGIATVNDSGLVTGISEGTVKITATTTDGTGLSDYAIVTIYKNYNVIYNSSKNGGSTEEKVVALRNHSKVDLSCTGERAGYEFVGWNTNPSAKEGLSEVSVEDADITVYAIFKKKVYLTIHLHDKNLRGYVLFFNNEVSKNIALARQSGFGVYDFMGYTVSKDSEEVINGGINVFKMEAHDTDLYAVYSAVSNLVYAESDGTTIMRDRVQDIAVANDRTLKHFVYTIRNGVDKGDNKFSSWSRKNTSEVFKANEKLITTDKEVTLIAMYTSTPTTETVTTEADEIEITDPDPTTEERDQPDNDSPLHPRRFPATGDHTPIVLITIVALIALGGLAILKKKEK